LAIYLIPGAKPRVSLFVFVATIRTILIALEHIVQGFHSLKACFQDGINFVTFTRQSINLVSILNILLTIVLDAGVFQLKNTKCHVLPNNEQTTVNTYN
jgi:hypothetical protein